MDQAQIDEFYHILRQLNLEDDLVQKEAVSGIVSHLMDSEGDYVGLLRFLSYYGDKYVLPLAIDFLKDKASKFEFTRVVELGAGFSWLSRGLGNAFNVPTLTADKRQWVFIDVVADIETQQGVERVISELKDGDLIVMCDLLHCLDDPQKVMGHFSRWPKLVLEYNPRYTHYKESYDAQIKAKGCKVVDGITDVFPGTVRHHWITHSHSVWLIEPQ